MKTTCYLQIEPSWRRWDPESLGGISVQRVTQKRPQSPIPGCVVVKIVLDIDDVAFLPLQPTVEVHIPVERTEAVSVESEPLEVAV